MAEMKQFLDKAGLEVFWGIIKDNFATKNSAVSYDSITVNTTSSAVGIRYKTIDESKNKLLDIPVANDTQAGIITAETFKDIKAVSGDIQAAVNINEIRLDGNTVVPTTDKIVDIKLDYISEAGNSLIRLVDSNNADVYSEINVSDFVKAGLLNFAKLVVNPSGQPEGTYIWLSFKTTSDPNNQASDIYINVTDLIDYYVGGEGISITANSVDGADNNRSERTINLKAAESDKLGGVKTGYTSTGKTYAVKLDENNNAYVEVPWYKVNADNTYVSASDNNTDKTTLITLTDSTKTSLGKADTALQSVNVLGISLNNTTGSTLTVDQAKTQLGLGAAAYKNIVNEFIKENVPSDDVAGAKAIKTYVDDEISKITGTSGYQQAITDAINALDSNIMAGKAAGTDGVNKQMFFTKITITDGMLDSANCDKAYISLSDVEGFGILSSADITEICTFE